MVALWLDWRRKLERPVHNIGHVHGYLRGHVVLDGVSAEHDISTPRLA